MATETLQIVVTESGSKVVKRNIEDVGKAAESTGNIIDELKTALKFAAAALGINELKQLADTYTEIKNQLRQVTDSAAELTVIYRRLLTVSNETRTSILTNAELYNDLVQVTQDLGLSSERLIGIQKTLNEAVALGGGNFDEALGILNRFILMLGDGTVSSREFRQVMIRLPDLADELSKAMGKSIEEISELLDGGKLRLNDFISAVEKAGDSIHANFVTLAPTIQGAFTVLRNQVIATWGAFDDGTGISAAVAQGIKLVADNLDTLAKAAATTGTAMLVAFAPGQIVAGLRAISSAVVTLTAAIAANPIGAIAVAIAAATAAMFFFGDQVAVTEDGVVTLKDVVVAAFNLIWDGIKAVADVVSKDLMPILALLSSAFAELGITWGDVWDALKKGLNFAIGGFIGFHNAIIEVFRGLPAALGDLFTQALNLVISKVEGAVNAIIQAVNSVSSYVGLTAIDEVTLGRLSNQFEGAATTVAESAQAAFRKGFETDYVGGVITAFGEEARKIAEERRAAEQGIQDELAKVDLTKPTGDGGGGGGATGESAEDRDKRLVKEAGELEQLVRSLDKVADARLTLASATKVLDREVAKGSISQEREVELLGIMEKQLQDQLDPLAAVTLALQEQEAQIGLTAEQQEISNQLRQIENDLLSAGIILNEQQLEQLETRLEHIQELTKAQEELNEAEKRRQGIVDDIRGPAESYNQIIADLNILLSEGKLTADEHAMAMKNAFLTYLESQRDVASGAQRALIKMHDEFTDFASITENAIRDAFKGAEDAVVSFVKTGKIEVSDFIDSVIEDLIRLGMRAGFSLLAEQIIGSIIPGAIGAADGSGLSFNTAGVTDSFVAASTFHEGGRAGAKSALRRLRPEVFANAARYHSGTKGAGLKHDEVAAVLQKGEQVIPVGAKSTQPMVTLNVVNNVSNANVTTQETKEANGGVSIELRIDEITSSLARSRGTKLNRALRDTFNLSGSKASR